MRVGGPWRLRPAFNALASAQIGVSEVEGMTEEKLAELQRVARLAGSGTS
jgi:hypothetical protein